ncbi:Ldh family oxidoreductase [Sporomusa acidovorans]|uniref:Oxidoreductase YjmC n=1 Tax=Sporomusa acidovorans (strain ATCC 49682 / DSM 3132 / Mol) TaxID=1123286 RepID=A0ABZ3J297_SPOA4|nr:Ldh family oxidoreductase [Sporomusa acidovorans]OZC24141.1 putative oxidoreductase YjmC [Sporomusa acidovorans DSM 3132]SDF36874.1 Malate/lactate/ureidoglycolate dehydrogenase, LDH2 family [Sporomusa acidovorans]
MQDSPKIYADDLRKFVTTVYKTLEVPEEDAKLVADSLVQADLWGHQSHGVLRLSWYVERLRRAVMHKVTQPKFEVDAGAIAVIDGQDGIGQVLAAKAADEAVKRAKIHGIGAVAVRNSNHFGTCMYFTLMAARQGCIGFLTTNGGPAIAPWGGMKKIIGTNPWSIAAPAGKHAPMVLDIANTAVARGKIYLARNKHEKIPLGWALTADGEPTTDPQAAIDGIIAPMAGHKGYAIGVMMDVLAGAMSGSKWGPKVNGPYHYDKKSGAGHFMIAMNIEAFRPLAAFNADIEEMIATIKSVPLAKGNEEVFYPGELEARNDVKNRQAGLFFPADTIADLQKVAGELGLESELPF